MKKYGRLLCSLIATLSLLAACQPDEVKLTEKASIQKLFNSRDGITLETEKENYVISNSEIVINMQNESEKRYIYYEDFSIQKNLDGTWYAVPVKEGKEKFELVVNSLKPKSSSSQTISLDRLENSLSPGEYRLVKDFYDPTDYFLDEKDESLGGRTLVATFQVTN